VISDIYANLPALGICLRAIDALGIDAVYCGGDLVGHGPQPIGVCRLIQARLIPAVYGDHDYAVGRDLDHRESDATESDRAADRQSVAWTLAHTDPHAKQYLRALPFDLRFELGNQRVRLVHGSPRSVNEHVLEDTPVATLDGIAAQADCDVLVFGHTRKPWIRTHAGILFVNCGSIGNPGDGDPRAAFALLELDRSGQVSASIQRVAYNARVVAHEIDAKRALSESAPQHAAAQ
jgi:putative phosphoesterase